MDRDQSVQFMHSLLRAMVSKKASDLFISAGFPPAFKVDGKMTPVSSQTLTAQMTSDLTRAMMNDKQAQEFEATKECNFAVAPAVEGDRDEQARHGHFCRRHRQRQVDFARGDDRIPQ